MESVLITLLVVIAGLYLFAKLPFPARYIGVKTAIEVVVIVLTLVWLVVGFWTPPNWTLSHRWNGETPQHAR